MNGNTATESSLLTGNPSAVAIRLVSEGPKPPDERETS
jgi:hypothetical protein